MLPSSSPKRPTLKTILKGLSKALQHSETELKVFLSEGYRINSHTCCSRHVLYLSIFLFSNFLLCSNSFSFSLVSILSCFFVVKDLCLAWSHGHSVQTKNTDAYIKYELAGLLAQVYY